MDILSLVARLSLDSSEYENGLNNAEGSASSFGSKLKKGLGTAAKVGVAALGTATAAVGAFAVSAVNAGKTFDASMSQVAATMGLTMEEMESQVGETDTAFGHFSGTLREFAQYMGSNTAFSATQAADALNYMALAGYDAQTSMNMLPNVLNLAAAGGMELATASDMITDAQTALGLSLEDTTEMVDIMAKVSSTTNTSVSQLGEAILTVGGSAKGLAYGTWELNGVLGVLADNGIKGAEAGTHLRNILLAMNPTTDDAAAAWEELGVQAYTAEGELRGLDVIFGELSEAMEDMTDQQKTEMLSNMFNKTDLASVNALLSTQKDRWNEVYIAIEESNGAASEMAATQLDNLAGDITLFQSALEGAKIAVSDQLTPSIREFVQFGTEGLSQLTAAFNEGGLSGAMEAFGNILSSLLEMVIEMLPSMIEAGMKLLSSLIDGIIKNLPSLINAAIDILKSLTDYIVKNLPMLLDAAIEIIFVLADGIIDAIPDLIPAVVEIILTIVEKLTEPSTLMQMIDTAFKIIGAVADGLIKAIPRLVEKVPTILMNLIEAILRFLPQLLASGTKLIVNMALGIVQGGADLVKSVVQVITNAKDSIMERVHDAANWGRDLIQNFINGILEKWNALKDTISNVAQTVKDFLGFSEPKEGPLSNFHTYAPDMMELFAKGIKDNEKLLTDQIESSFDFENNITGKTLSGAGTSNAFTINVYGAQGQDEQKIVDILIDEITRRTEREKVAFA